MENEPGYKVTAYYKGPLGFFRLLPDPIARVFSITFLQETAVGANQLGEGLVKNNSAIYKSKIEQVGLSN